MTLEEVVYQIDGALRREVGESAFMVSLFDKAGDVVSVVRKNERNILARATGDTFDEARCHLVGLLRGNTLLCHLPVPWREDQALYLRIPETLVP